MWRHLGPIGIILILAAPPARADDNAITLSVSGLPADYTPGSTLTFQVGLSGAADLNAYDVGLDLTSRQRDRGLALARNKPGTAGSVIERVAGWGMVHGPSKSPFAPSL